MKPKPKPKNEMIATTVRVPREFWSKVRTRAFEEKLGTAELIIKALDQYLKGGSR